MQVTKSKSLDPKVTQAIVLDKQSAFSLLFLPTKASLIIVLEAKSSGCGFFILIKIAQFR